MSKRDRVEGADAMAQATVNSGGMTAGRSVRRRPAHCRHSLPRRQQGVAIITAMLLIALGTITIVSITNRQQLDMQRERNEGIILQARAIGVSGERFAAALLYRDVQAGLRENTDSLDDDWAQTIPPIPIDNASIQGCIVDMQGRFNLNNLVNADGEAVEFYVNQLTRLLLELNIDETKAQAIVDWVDKDINATIPEGAEDDYYTGLEYGYRAANRPFVSVSELQLVKGFSSAIEAEADDYERLLPHISALPTDNGPTPVNVNTATPEVLASLSDEIKPLAADLSRWDTGAYEDYPECEDIFDLSADDGPETLAGAGRDLEPYESTLLFDQEVDSADTGEESAPAGSYDVRSSYFQVRIDVEAEGIKMSQYTLFERDAEGKTRVLYRSRDTL
ncbi:type II secretion system minor pseudopilin GspK [Granulosicoccus sp. 3-233]|uniref:type II secretion system minor pseudopilin GspK n=1 Tax=Granulosicoccus sp. 3-233 TaxID=3417969 RepID=UPI003D350B65